MIWWIKLFSRDRHFVTLGIKMLFSTVEIGVTETSTPKSKFVTLRFKPTNKNQCQLCRCLSLLICEGLFSISMKVSAFLLIDEIGTSFRLGDTIEKWAHAYKDSGLEIITLKMLISQLRIKEFLFILHLYLTKRVLCFLQLTIILGRQEAIPVL